LKFPQANATPKISKEQNETIETIGLHSARCNQHSQSRMNIQELMAYGGLLAQRISNIISNQRKLFDSIQWLELIKQLRK